jgi:hypothetical protein
MQTEHNTTTPETRKPWSQPEIVLISQANVEAKVRTAGHEKSFAGSAAGTPGRHFLYFKGPPKHSAFTPVAVTVGDFVS